MSNLSWNRNINTGINKNAYRNTTTSQNGLVVPFFQNNTIYLPGSLSYSDSENTLAVNTASGYITPQYMSSNKTLSFSGNAIIPISSQVQNILLNSTSESFTVTLPGATIQGGVIPKGCTLNFSLVTQSSLPVTVAIPGQAAQFILDTKTFQETIIYTGATYGWIPFNSATSFFPLANGMSGVMQIVPKDAVGESTLGLSLSLSSDGHTLAIGGSSDSSGLGATWIYTLSNATGLWSEQVKIVPSDGIGTPNFGISVSLSADGNTLAIGGYADNGNNGAIWVYTRSDSQWSEVTKLTAIPSNTQTELGMAITISGDGNTIASGANSSTTGGTFVFSNNLGIWSQQGAMLLGSGGIGFTEQGIGLDLNFDGNTLVIGGPADNSDIGAAWVFTRSNGTWNQFGDKLPMSLVTSFGGYSISLSSDGTTFAAGGYSYNNEVGGVWIFDYDIVSDTYINTTLNTGPLSGYDYNIGFGDVFQGTSVILSSDGNTCIFGGPYDASGTGAVWFFTRATKDDEWIQQGPKRTFLPNNFYYQGYGIALSSYGNIFALGGPYNLAGSVWASILN